MYRGRFAPSPTGPLHFGSLIAATGSYLQARKADGQWLLRIEDLDRVRSSNRAADDIIETLNIYGFQWDNDIILQSTRSEHYTQALTRLEQQELLYACQCSRQQVRRDGVLGLDGWVYAGTCKPLSLPLEQAHTALRLRVEARPLSFDDLRMGRQQYDMLQAFGDFIVRRADNQFSYPLAVVVDDNLQGITEVVRGNDLLHATAKQIYLQQKLAIPQPSYLHLPIALGCDGLKLSKQNGAQALNKRRPQQTLVKALEFLGQKPPDMLKRSPVADVWEWAIEHWKIARIPASPRPQTGH